MCPKACCRHAALTALHAACQPLQPCASPTHRRVSLCATLRRAYFNGVHVSGLLSMKTFFVKLLSAIFVLAAGLVAEGESPFVHVGAIVGGGFSSMGSRCARLQPQPLHTSAQGGGMTAGACPVCRAQVADARDQGALAGQAAALGGRLVPRRGGAPARCCPHFSPIPDGCVDFILKCIRLTALLARRSTATWPLWERPQVTLCCPRPHACLAQACPAAGCHDAEVRLPRASAQAWRSRLLRRWRACCSSRSRAPPTWARLSTGARCWPPRRPCWR